MTNTIYSAGLTVAEASALARHALNCLDDDDPCCSNCCAPCHTLIGLKARGALDVILAADGPRHFWWDDDTGQVSQQWLDEHIRPYHEDGPMLDPHRCTDEVV